MVSSGSAGHTAAGISWAEPESKFSSYMLACFVSFQKAELYDQVQDSHLSST